MSKFCLALLCPPQIEEKLLDTLLVTVVDGIFTSTPTFSHGTAHGRMDSVEQVMGRSRSVKIEILVAEEEMARLLKVLRESFAGTGVRYWALPLAAEGEIE
jgi:hypothetical protein